MRLSQVTGRTTGSILWASLSSRKFHHALTTHQAAGAAAEEAGLRGNCIKNRCILVPGPMLLKPSSSPTPWTSPSC